MTTMRTSFLRRSLDAFIAARQRQAEIYVNQRLLMLDDRTLESMGYRRADLAHRASGFPY